MDDQALRDLAETVFQRAMRGLGVEEPERTAAEQDRDTFAAEIRRIHLALRILGGLPDDEGHTHTAELGGRHAEYARGVLTGAAPLPVADALREGE